MAVAFVGGAALGALFGELLRGIVKAKRTTDNFNPNLSRLESMLKHMIPIINNIEEFNIRLDRPEEETRVLTKQMEEGIKLVGKCSKVDKYNCWKKYLYSKRLGRLEESIRSFIGCEMQVQSMRDCKENLLETRGMHRNVSRLISGNMNGSFCWRNGFSSPCAVPELPSLTVGLDGCLREVKLQLLQSGTSVLVVSAPGGYGKTTFAKKMCRDEEIEGKFKENIFFVTVSKVHSTKAIIQKIFRHKVHQIPEFENDEIALNQLEQLLKEIEPSPILMVLDDVWNGSESLLDKFHFQISDYKILITSRFEFPRFSSTYHLKPLNDEDARTLFCHSAFLQNGSSCIQDKDLVNKIVKGCRGVPLALKVVGRSLCGQPAVIWRSRLADWSSGLSIFDSHSDLLVCLQSSLDVLHEQLKECFMDLGFVPEDQRINAAALIDIWVELYNLDDDGVSAMVKLYELSHRNLANLLLTTDNANDIIDGFYNDHTVMQHDLLRELAIHQCKLESIEQRKRVLINIIENKYPKWWSEKKQQAVNCRLLSISTDELFSSCWCNMQLPSVEVLVLNFQTKNYVLPNFMESMNKLKVLMATNYGLHPSEISNFSQVGTLSNLKRIRIENVNIHFSQIALPMKNLKKMSLVMCDIDQAFENCSMETANMFPNLVEINIDYSINMARLPAALCNIVHLKKLSVTNCHGLSSLEGIEKLVNIEVMWLHSCTGLLEIPDSIRSLHNLRILDISDCLSIRKLPKQIGELCSLRKLNLNGCSRLCKLPLSTKDLKHLEVVICDEETALLWDLFKPHISQLRIEATQEDINLNWLQDVHL